MRLLLTNDDGIDAPGLAALEAACAGIGSEVWVVAPRAEASQIGHRVTTHEPIAVERRGPRSFAVSGTPADCVRLALKGGLLDDAPDCVLSGINAGGNLGRHDIYISGTVAAAREAAFHGFRALAVSHFLRGDLPFSWEIAIGRARRAIEGLIGEALGPGEIWNINLPHNPAGAPEPAIVHCDPEPLPLEVAFEKAGDDRELYRYTGRYQHRAHRDGSDVARCFGGDIAVSRVGL